MQRGRGSCSLAPVSSPNPRLLIHAAPLPGTEPKPVLLQQSWSLHPCWESGWFGLICSFVFWRHSESQANSFLLPFLQHRPLFTACQQHTSARSHPSLPAVTLWPFPSVPFPGIRRERSLASEGSLNLRLPGSTGRPGASCYL